MFTLKFFKYTSDAEGDCTIQETIICPNYSTYTRDSGILTVITYPSMTNENGVDRNIGEFYNDEEDFSVCYVENSAGKTIDKFVVN